MNKIGMCRSRIIRPLEDEGESIEEMVRRATTNKEPIEATSPMIYTEEKDGVQPQYDPRTDKWEIALDAVDKYNKSLDAQSENNNVEQKPAEPNAQEEVGNSENG